MRRPLVLEEMARMLLGPPSTVRYPRERAPIHPGYQGRIAILDEKCVGCSRCAIVCPTACITMVPSERPVEVKGRTIVRKRKPEVELYACIQCGLCEEYCPTDPKAIYLTAEKPGSSLGRNVVVR